MKKLPLKLTSKRLLFRKPQLTDATLLYSTYTSDPEVTRFVTWKPHSSVSQTQDFLNYCLSRWDEGNELNYLVETLEDHKLIGMVKIAFNNNTVNLGYVFARKFWGQGYATEAVKTFIKSLFTVEKIKIIQAFCDVENVASAKVMKKSGMKYRKKLPSYITHPNISSNKRDCFLYSITKDEYESQRESRDY